MATATVECRDSNTSVDVRTNSLGLRGPELVVPKPADLYRIVVLGDETIFAPETPDSDHFCSQLQSLLQTRSNTKFEVINAGVPGHCPLTEFLHFKQRLIALQPDLVLLHFDWSDVSDDRLIRRRAKCDRAGVPQSVPHAKLASAKKTRPHDVWRQQIRLIDMGLNVLSTEWKQEAARQKSVSRDVDANPYAWLRDEQPRKNAAFVQAILPIRDLAQLCRNSHCQLVIITSPKPWQVSAKCSRGTGVRMASGVAQDACFLNRAPFDDLASFTSKGKVPFIDGSNAISQGRTAESNFLKNAPRWSPEGHRRMAELVANRLSETVTGPWTNPYQPPKDQPMTSVDRPRDNAILWTSGQTPPPFAPPAAPDKPRQ